MVNDVEILFHLKNHVGLVSVVIGRLQVVWFFLLAQPKFRGAVLCWAVVA